MLVVFLVRRAIDRGCEFARNRSGHICIPVGKLLSYRGGGLVYPNLKPAILPLTGVLWLPLKDSFGVPVTEAVMADGCTRVYSTVRGE